MRRRRGPGRREVICVECSRTPVHGHEDWRAIVGRAPLGVRSPPYLASVPRRRAHVGDGRVWAPVRSMR